MKNQKTLSMIILVLLATFLAMGSAVAQSTTDFVATATYIRTLDDGEQWLDAKGNYHVMGEVQLFKLNSTDRQVAGTFTIEVNLLVRQDENGLYCNGPAYGELNIYPKAVNGVWETTWSGMFTDCVFTGQADGHGTGDLEGQEINFIVQEINPPGADQLDLMGQIDNPGGG